MKAQEIIDAIDQTDNLLQGMRGQLNMVQECAEHSGAPLEFNDTWQVAIVMKTLIDDVRAQLDEVAERVQLAFAKRV